MTWRTVELDDEQWTISPAAERRPDAPGWHLALSFRAMSDRARAFWAPYPATSISKALLFARAEHIPDDHLVALLSERLASRSGSLRPELCP